MKKISWFCLVILFFDSSCKKSSSEPSGNNNEIRATINAKDGSISSFVFTGSEAKFLKMSFPEIYYISIGASTPKGGFSITLTNINQPGTYTISATLPPPGEKHISGSFTTGSYGSNSLEVFSPTAFPTPSLTITVDEITDHFIKGSFDMTCQSTAGGIVQITEGSFKGNF